MAKIEEIYQKQWEQKWEGLTFRSIPDQQSHIFAAMKEYAEWYSNECINSIKEKCLEIDNYGDEQSNWIEGFKYFKMTIRILYPNKIGGVWARVT